MTYFLHIPILTFLLLPSRYKYLAKGINQNLHLEKYISSRNVLNKYQLLLSIVIM